jgi:hypothetical protein
MILQHTHCGSQVTISSLTPEGLFKFSINPLAGSGKVLQCNFFKKTPLIVLSVEVILMSEI